MENIDNIFLKWVTVLPCLFTIIVLYKYDVALGGFMSFVLGFLILKLFNMVDFYDVELTIKNRRIKDLETLLGRKEELESDKE